MCSLKIFSNVKDLLIRDEMSSDSSSVTTSMFTRLRPSDTGSLVLNVHLCCTSFVIAFCGLHRCVCIVETERERDEDGVIEVYMQQRLKVKDKSTANVLRELSGAQANGKWNRSRITVPPHGAEETRADRAGIQDKTGGKNKNEKKHETEEKIKVHIQKHKKKYVSEIEECPAAYQHFTGSDWFLQSTLI